MARIVFLFLMVASLHQVVQGSGSSNSSFNSDVGSDVGVDARQLIAPCTASCPVGYTQVAVSPTVYECYNLVTVRATWESALSSCVRSGGWLTWITSKEQNDGITNYLKSQSSILTTTCQLGIFFGMQRQDPQGCTTPMVWKGNCGETQPVVYSNWEPGQPDCSVIGSNIQRCGSFWTSVLSLGWDDLACETQLCYLCQAHHL